MVYIKKVGFKDFVIGKVGFEDGKWWWFNDDKVIEVMLDKIDVFVGGGEFYFVFICFYKVIFLFIVEGVME